MIFVLNKDFKTILTLRIDETNKSNTRYFDDIYNGNLETGTATFKFSSPLNHKTGEAIVGGNYIAYTDDNNKLKVFQIMIVEQISNSIPSLNAYCESAGMELLNEPFRARKINPCNVSQFLTVALSETDCELGYIDDSLIDVVTISDIDKDINRLKLIQQEISKFNCDIEFIAELKNGCLKKYVNAYKRKGKLYKTRLEIQRNTDEIVRTVDFTNVATALIGQGNDGLKFTDIEIEGIEKPIGQDFVYDVEAFERYNVNGRHLFRIYEYDTDSPHELLRKTNEALQTYSKPNVKYEIKADLFSSLSNEDFYSLEEGDTFYITDYNFVPPLFLEARVSDLTKSKTNKSNNKVIFSNFKELKSNISKSKITGRQIIKAINDNTSDEVIDSKFIDVDNLRVRGEFITGQINGLDGIKFADGAYASTYDYGVAKGLSISAPDFKIISGNMHFEYGIDNINNNWSIDKYGNGKFNGSISVKNSIKLTNGSVYLPQGGGNHVVDYLRLGEVIMAGLNSFHFITKSGERATIYANNLNTMYSIPENSISTTNVNDIANDIFDIINSVNIIETENGLRIIDKQTKECINNNCINISINKKTKEKDISISVIDTLTILWKAIQELKYENNYIKNKIEGV